MPAPVDFSRLREEGVVKEASRHYVVDDLEPLGEVVGPRYEIIDGELYMSPSPHHRHQGVVHGLVNLLSSRAKAVGGRLYVSPVDVVIAEDVVVVPDLFVLTGPKVAAVDASESGAIHEVPDLVVEVLSPGTAWYDRTVKKNLYERARVAEYWIVDGDERSVHQFRLSEGRYVEAVLAGAGAALQSDLLGGAAISVQDIFNEIG